MKFTVGWALLAASALLSGAQAQTHKVQPGLWENQVTIQTGDPVLDQMAADMQARMAGLPPDQRQMIEQMMASRGMRMGTKPNTLQACITPEQAARDELPQQSEQCKQVEAQRSGNTVKVKFSCETSPAGQRRGRVHAHQPDSLQRQDAGRHGRAGPAGAAQHRAQRALAGGRLPCGDTCTSRSNALNVSTDTP
jgi:Protein of unknown function (DUF3617)